MFFLKNLYRGMKRKSTEILLINEIKELTEYEDRIINILQQSSKLLNKEIVLRIAGGWVRDKVKHSLIQFKVNTKRKSRYRYFNRRFQFRIR